MLVGWRSSCFNDFNRQNKEEIKTKIRVYTKYQKWLTCDYCSSFRMYYNNNSVGCAFLFFDWRSCCGLFFSSLYEWYNYYTNTYLNICINKIELLSVGNINNNFKPWCHLHYRYICCTEIILYCNVMCFVCKFNKMHLSYYWVIILSTCLY